MPGGTNVDGLRRFGQEAKLRNLRRRQRQLLWLNGRWVKSQRDVLDLVHNRLNQRLLRCRILGHRTCREGKQRGKCQSK